VIELIPDSYVARLDPLRIFQRDAPVHIDLGCGDGTFLFALAQRHHEKNFLGIERLSGRVEKASRKAAKIANMRVLNVETSYAVRYLLPELSVETFYLLFPDPWPKRRHHQRRIVTPEFLNSIHSALEERGTLRIATDQLDYFRQIERLASDAAEGRTLKLDCLKQSSSRFNIVDHDDDDLPVTKFERRFRQQGAPIYRLTLRKVSPVK
jgi:tRNA (guanine-N7-)-methyltransferase